jgi:fructose-1,6-bisphosphatase I
MKVPEEGTIYSVNEGNGALWDAQVNKHFDFVKGVIDHTVPEQFSALKRPQSLRYVGSMVADIQRTMLSGGLFAYPHDKRSSCGKLRLLYECFPMAFVVEHAGGRAIDGKGSNILDLTPLKVLEGQRSLLIHVRSPIILGSAKNVALYEYFMSSN